MTSEAPVASAASGERISDREFFPHRTRFDHARLLGLRAMQISVDDTVGFEGLAIEDIHDPSSARPTDGRVIITDPLLLAEAEDALGCLDDAQRRAVGKPEFALRRLGRTYRGSASDYPTRVYSLGDLPNDIRAQRDLACLLRPHLPSNFMSDYANAAASSATSEAGGKQLVRAQFEAPVRFLGSPVAVDAWLRETQQRDANFYAPRDASDDASAPPSTTGQSDNPCLDQVLRIVVAHVDSDAQVGLTVDVPFWRSAAYPGGPFDPVVARLRPWRFEFAFDPSSHGASTDSAELLTDDADTLLAEGDTVIHLRGHLLERVVSDGDEEWQMSMGGLGSVLTIRRRPASATSDASHQQSHVFCRCACRIVVPAAAP